MTVINVLIAWIIRHIAPAIGFLLGGAFAWIDLARKYPTTQKYLLRLASAYLYIFISAVGASGVTYALKVLGVSFSSDPALNTGIISLLGAGLFIGILSTVALPTASENQFGAQLKTLRDFVFEYLNTSINRKLTQRFEREIKRLQYNIIDPERFHKEADLILDGVDELKDDEKRELSLKFMMYVNDGKYASIIRELTKYRDIDFIKQQLSEENILQTIWFDGTKENQPAANFLKEMWAIITQFLKDEQDITQEFCNDLYSLIYDCFGKCAQKNGKPAVAEKYYQKAFGLAEKNNDPNKQAMYCGNLGQLALENEQWNEASKWFLKEYSLTNDTKNLPLLAQAKAGLAYIFKAEKRTDQAQQWANEALEIYSQIHAEEKSAEMQQLIAATQAPLPETTP